MIASWRRTGADLPFGDPAGHHGVPMEGYYWRLVDPASGRSSVAICGTLAGGARRDALVALAPDGAPPRWAWAGEPVEADTRHLGLRAGGLLVAGPAHLSVDLGPGARLEAAIVAPPWPRALGGLGAAHLLPRLGQYWHPHMLGGTATGTVDAGDGMAPLGPCVVYAEKNWGRAFPRRWWWGQAGSWSAGDDAAVAFAGGTLGRHSRAPAATAVVLRLGDDVLRLVAPAAMVGAHVAAGEWSVRARGPRTAVAIDGGAGADDPLRLPVPAPDGRAPGHVDQHQRGRVRVVARRGRRVLWRGETAVAGLESGEL